MTDIISKDDQISMLETVLAAAKNGTLNGLSMSAVTVDGEVICCFVDTGGHYHLFDELSNNIQTMVFEQRPKYKGA